MIIECYVDLNTKKIFSIVQVQGWTVHHVPSELYTPIPQHEDVGPSLKEVDDEECLM
jgi:hypothetical protein